MVQIKRLEAIQNAFARAVIKIPEHHHISPVLKSLHWLKTTERIEYKVLSFTNNTLKSSKPSYTSINCSLSTTSFKCSSSILTLFRPIASFSLKFANRYIAIHVAVTPFWNKLLPVFRHI